MPISEVIYKCGICQRSYDNFNDASKCESLPIDEKGKDINIGDEISYTEESGGLGSHWGYGGATNKVLLKYNVLSSDGQNHSNVFIVNIGDTKRIKLY